MRGLPKAQLSAVEGACLTLGGGGAGSLGTLAITHSSSAAAAIAVSVVAIVASLSAGLPRIIAALNDKKVARLRAETEAHVALEAARQRTALVNAGLEGQLEAAVSLLKLQPLDAQVLTDPGLSEDVLRALLPGPRASPGTGPRLAVDQSRAPEAQPATPQGTPQPASPRAVAAKRRRSRRPGERGATPDDKLNPIHIQ